MTKATVQTHSRTPSVWRTKAQPIALEAGAIICIILLMVVAWLYCWIEQYSDW